MISKEKHLNYLVKAKKGEIDEIINRIDDYYYEKRELKYNKKTGELKKDKYGKPKERVLNPSIGRLKEIQKKIDKEILKKLSMPEYAYGGIKGKDNILNAKQHQGKKFKFMTDMKDFFPSITNDMVFEMYINNGFSPTIASILTKLTTYKGHIPQGAATSTSLANLVFIKTGRKILKIAKENNITFTTFVDDLTLSSPVDFKDKVPEILNIIRLDNYVISHQKTNYKTSKTIITGVESKNNGIKPTEEQKIKLLQTTGKTDAQIKGIKNYIERINKISKTKIKSIPI